MFEHRFAALFDFRAAALLETQEQLLHRPDLPNHPCQFSKLFPRQLFPAYGYWSLGPKTKEKIPNFSKSKSCLPRPLNNREPIKSGSIVASLSTHALRRRQYPDLLVVTKSGSANSKLARNL